MTAGADDLHCGDNKIERCRWYSGWGAEWAEAPVSKFKFIDLISMKNCFRRGKFAETFL